ncbi:hypothetical protein TNCV_2289901 [Trichonephila clavipes]|uniref:Uncharacterized protein n=1 Tax=Trichonephila clavipes TaxID=2585209 RepID=A0A8X6RKX9_TRICX|nr:hypothetical protein TNCV_2289901 [Trichonephila clavipes]
MAAVDFLHQENPPTWAGSNPQHWIQKASDKPTTPQSRTDTTLLHDKLSSTTKSDTVRKPVLIGQVAMIRAPLQISPMVKPGRWNKQKFRHKVIVLSNVRLPLFKRFD